MKNQLLIILAIFILSGCTTSYQYQYVRNHNLTPVVTIPHKEKVAIYFDKEEIKDPYIQIKVIEVAGGNYQTLINKLKKAGQIVGVDGILILNKTSAEYVSGTEDYIYTESLNTLYGLGIKFKKNIDYLDRFIKKEHLFLVEDGVKTKVATIQKSMEGDIINRSDNLGFYDKYILPFDIRYLFFDNTPTWYYTLSDGQISSRVLKRKNGLTTKRIQFNYSGVRLNTITITKPYSEPKHVKIMIEYLKNSNRVGRKTIKAYKITWQEVLLYNDEQKLIGKKIYKIIDGEKVPFLEVEFEFYKNSDLEDILNDE